MQILVVFAAGAHDDADLQGSGNLLFLARIRGRGPLLALPYGLELQHFVVEGDLVREALGRRRLDGRGRAAEAGKNEYGGRRKTERHACTFRRGPRPGLERSRP